MPEGSRVTFCVNATLFVKYKMDEENKAWRKEKGDIKRGCKDDASSHNFRRHNGDWIFFFRDTKYYGYVEDGVEVTKNSLRWKM